MIKLVQGFVVGSPLPIDGRILLSKAEMKGNFYLDPESLIKYNLDDILPDHYFAFCSDEDDNRLYLFDKKVESKVDPDNGQFGKFILANEEVYDTIDEVETDLTDLLNTTKKELSDNIKAVDDKVEENVTRLDGKIDSEVERAIAEEENIKATHAQDKEEIWTAIEDNFNILDTKIDDRVSELDDKIEAETSRATAVEEELNTKTKDLATNLDNLSTKVDNNYDTLNSKINIVSGDLGKETTNRLKEDNAIREDLIDESEIRSKADKALHDRMNGYQEQFEEYKDETDARLDRDEELLNKVNVDINGDGNTIPGLRKEFDDHVLENEADFESDRERITKLEEDINGKDQEKGIKENLNDTMDRVTTLEDKTAKAQKDIEDILIDIRELDADIEDINTSVSNINTEMNKNVLTSTEVFEVQPSAVVIGQNLVNIKTGHTDFKSYNLPLANEINAGLMSPMDVNAITVLQEKVKTLSGGSVRLRYEVEGAVVENKFTIQYMGIEYQSSGEPIEYRYDVEYTLHNVENPTQLYITPDGSELPEGTEFHGTGTPEPDGTYKVIIYEKGELIDPIAYFFDLENNVYRREVTPGSINSFAIDSGYELPFEGIAIVISSDNHVWRYYVNEYAWVDEGIDSVELFNNTNPGIILGAGEKPGFVYAEADGTGSVFGWDDLNTTVVNATTDIINIKEQLDGPTREFATVEELATKVDKEHGKELIPSSDLNRLYNIASQANKITDAHSGDGIITVTKRENGVETSSDLTVYSHPTGSAASKTSGFYKISTDAHSHVASTTNVGASDITALNPYVAGEGITSANASGAVKFSLNRSTQSTLSKNNWRSSSGLYTQQLTVANVTVDSEPIVDLDLTTASSREAISSLMNEWSKVAKADTSAEKITFYATEIPTVDLVINIKVM